MNMTKSEINQGLWLVHGKELDNKKAQEAEQMLKKLANENFGKYEQLFDHTLIISVTVDKRQFEYKGVKINVVPHPQKPDTITLLFGTSVCTLHDHPEVNFMEMLQRNHDSVYAKVVIVEGEYLEVEASANYDHVTASEITAMIKEVADLGYLLRKQILK
ncbi:hypothetical protein BKI52_22560 [marine bacterium AO1-C]|nr:hypothetical protein BKI52_22560 [marine bacterium AO1-C]